MKGRTIKIKNITISLSAVLWLSVFVAFTFTGVYIAKYRMEMKKEVEMIAADFHISSNYLENEDDDKEYDIYDWSNGFEIELYNYEKENITSLAADDITYKIECNNAEYSYDGDAVLKAGEPSVNTIKIMPDGTDDVTVTVTTTSPFKKSLNAKFNLEGSASPTLSTEHITDNGDYYLITVSSYQYGGKAKISYDESLVPDTTNPVWADAANGIISVEPFCTYELIFFNPENKNCKFSITATQGE